MTGSPDRLAVARLNARELARVADVPEPPSRPLRPVGWLLAPELLAQMRSILHRRRNDPRDWMPVVPGHAHIEDGAPDAGRVRDVRIETLGGSGEHEAPEGEPGPPLIVPPESGELWFDYVADTGDGATAMFTVAYLLQAELVLDPAAADSDRTHGASVTVRGAPDGGPTRLPRGQFLVCGGDTAYHVADQATLAARVRAPFTWAARALIARGASLHPRRRLYGLPGNHDWYDDLDGFGALFRKDLPGTVTRPRPTWLASLFGLEGLGPHGPRLDLAGFEKAQTASYAAIALPWDWQLFALDVDIGLDPRQELYFRSMPRATQQIVCTASPAIAMGTVWAEPAHRDALARLDLPPHFDVGAPQPTPGTCRLDLAGDVHHYARYEAPTSPAADPAAVAGTTASYRSVVAGLGGAFHHPTFPVIGDRKPAAVFPSPDASRRAAARRLFNPIWLFRGGLLRVVPLAFCFFLALAATHDSTGTGWLFDHLLDGVGIDREAGVWTDTYAFIGARTGSDVLVTAAYFLAGLLGAAVLVVAALWWGGRVSEAHARDPDRARSMLELKRAIDLVDPKRSYWLAWTTALAGCFLPFVVPLWYGLGPLGLVWFDVAFYLVVLISLTGGVVLGAVIGARRHPWPKRIVLGIAGLLHAVMQLLTPFVIARIALAAWWAVPAMVAITAAGLPIGRAIFARGGRGHAFVLAAVGLGFAAATLAIAILAADGVAVAPATTAEQLVVWVGGALCAMFFGCSLLGWYLAICGAFDGHFNEIAAAALIDRYRQFIRFRLTPTELTAYVIAVDDVSLDPAKLRPHLVDRFRISGRQL